MYVDLDTMHRRDRYQWMISSVIPRPIALVSTVSGDGVVNLAPFSWFNGVASEPPLVSLAIGTKRRGVLKDTLNNLRTTGELVIHLVNESMLDPMVIASGEWPADQSELDLARFTAVPSRHVAPPRIAESPLAFECRLERVVELGEPPTSLVLARVLGIEVQDSTMRGGLPAPDLLQPVSRLGGDLYATLGTLLMRARPVVGNADPLKGAGG